MSEDKNSEWDPESFEGGSDWNEEDQSKAAATRLQDLSIGFGGSTHQPKKQENKSWPFESSPCRWTGGKNTRPGPESEKINQEIFDPDFQADAKMDFEDAGNDTAKNAASIGEGDDESLSIDPSSDDDSSSSSEDSFCGESSDEEQEQANTRMKAPNEFQRQAQSLRPTKTGSSRNGNPPEGQVGEEGHPTFDNRPKQSQSNARAPVQRRSSLGSERSSRSQRSDDLSSSMHAKTRKPTRTSSKDELSSRTYHGPASQSRIAPARDAAPSKPAQSRRGPRPARTKSFDAGNNDLGAATMHGTGVGKGAVRGGKRRPTRKNSSSTSSGAPGERRLLKRAMSIRNVKRPEEYVPGKNPDEDESRHSSRSRLARTRSMDVDSRVAAGRMSSHEGGRRPQQQRSRTAQEEDSGDSSHAKPPAPKQSRTRQDSLTRSSSQRQIQSRPSPPPRRDLIGLLKEEKKVALADMQHKENRRVLHFLMYENKMGLDMKLLHDAIRQEQEELALADDPVSSY